MHVKQSTRFLFLVLSMFFLSILQMNAQIEVEPALSSPLTPEALIREVFAGKGVEITNVRFSGQKEAIGYFKNDNTNLNLSEGFLMTTGSAVLAAQPNQNNGDGATNQSTAMDATLQSIVNDGEIQDLAVYEIEFIPKYDTIEFNYVFASEEYPEFGCNCFNDVFGFFLRGPGFTDWTNLAVVPGTLNDPVSVKTIHPLDPDGNGGSSSCTSNSTLPDCNPVNDHLYIDNTGSSSLTYDGLTRVLSAKTRVEKCQPYTIKLAIADVGDDLFDSAVFFEANSFGTDALDVTVEMESIDGTLIEGCAGGTITFAFDEPVESDYRVGINFEGRAINGVDFAIEPRTDAIPAGETSLTLSIRALADTQIEGVDSIGLVIDINECEQETFWFKITDSDLQELDLGEDMAICPGDSIQLDGRLGTMLPTAMEFQANSGNLDINTVDDNGTGPATEASISTISVDNVQPAEIRAGLIKEVCVQIIHNNLEDIDLILESPSGQLLELTSDNGGSGSNYEMTCFSPDAITPIESGIAPFIGSFQPEGDWENLYGSTTNGDWKLYVKDDLKGDDGFLLNWSISFNPLYDLSYQWIPDTGLSCANCPNPKAAPSVETSYELNITDTYGCIIRDSITIKTTNDTIDIDVICIEETQNSITFGWNPTTDVMYEVNVDGQGWISPSGAGAHTVSGLAEGQTVAIEIRGSGDCINQKGATDCTTSVCFPPDASISRVINQSCYDIEDGRIDFEADDPNIIFIIGTDTSFNKRFTNLAAGSFAITALDTSTTCFIQLDTVIIAPDTLKIDTFSMAANCGMTNGVAAVIPSGGTAPYTYLWDIAAGTDTIKNQGPGTYTVVVTDDNGCSLTQSVTVEADDTPVQMGMTISCADVSSNSITYSWVPVDGVALYEVQIGEGAWSAPSASSSILVPNLNILESVQIRVRGSADCITVLDSMTCMTADCTPPTGDFNIVRAGRCTDYTDGVLSFTSDSPNVVYIMDGDTTAIGVYEDMPPGRYTVELLDTITLCNSFTDTVLFNPEPLVIETYTQSENCGEQDGVAAVTPTGGVAPYEVFWDIGSITDTVKNLTSEIYPVTVIDDRGCSENLSLQIDLNIDNLQDLRLEVKCPNVTNNSINFTWDQVADITNYEVNVNGAGWEIPNSDFFAHELTNLGFSEIFNVQVRGNSDCGGAVVGNQICATRNCIPPTATIVTEKNVSCVGRLDGGLDVVINTFPFSFVDTTGFVVIDSAGINVIDFSQFTVDTLTAPIGGLVIIGSDTIEATEANPMVNFEGLAPGTYNLNLMDTSLTCRSTREFVIGEPDSLGIITNFEGPVTCTNANDGLLVAFGAGGTPGYTYNWNDGEFNEEVYSDLAPGNYDLVVTDANGCTTTESYIIAEPDSLIAEVYIQNIGCGETNTGVAAIVSNSSVPYEVTWTTGETTDTISNLAPDTYEAVVINENDCVDNIQVTINAVDLVLNTTTTMPLCGNENMETALITATAFVTASGNPEGMYTYEWNDVLSQTTDTASMLSPGQYIVTVTDLNANCTKMDTIDIDAPPPLITNILNTDNETCPGEGDGSVIFNTEGGTPGYEYDWGDEFVRTTPGRNDLAAGNYIITITDDNGCEQELEFRINAPDSIKLAFEVEEITCLSDRGAATVLATGGSGDFSYQWNDLNNQTTAEATELSEAEFTVVVRDNVNGCEETGRVAITEATPLTLITTSTPSLCVGMPTGTAMVEASGGSGNYLYLWDDEMAQETPMAESLNPGDYMVLVLDDAGCEDSVLVTVEDSSIPIEIEFRKEDISCAGETDGMSEVEVTGGSPQYTYEWSTGATSRMINSLEEGSYMLTVTDQNGCTNTDTVSIITPELLAGSFVENNISCTGERDGQIEVRAMGGTGAYQYSIDGNRFTSESVFPNLRENNYEVFVRDEMGCIADLGIVAIIEPEEIEVLVDGQLILEADKINTLDALVTNGTGEIFYEWTSDKEQESILCVDCPNPEIKPQFGQTYSVLVTDENGCEASSSVQVLVRQERGVFVPTGFSPNSDGLNDMLMVHGKEGTRVLTFKIFDRWGELVYQNNDFMVNDIEGAWDGMYRGQALNSAVFTWYAEVQFADGLQDIVKGHTTLVR